MTKKVDLDAPLVKNLPEGGRIITAKNGRALYVRVWEPTVSPIAVVLFFHGLGEHCDRYEHVFAKFAANGIRVKTFDHRGHGRTLLVDTEGYKGHLSLLEDYSDALTVLELDGDKDAGLPVFSFGHSLGGLLAILFAHDHAENKLAGLIASAPAIRPGGQPPGAVTVFMGKLVGAIAPKAAIPNGLVRDNLSRDKSVIDAYVADPLNHDKLSLGLANLILNHGSGLLHEDFSSQPHLPILVVHGTADILTSPEASRLFFDQLKVSDKIYKSIEGAFHELHNEIEPVRTEVLDTYVQWIKDKSQPKASL